MKIGLTGTSCSGKTTLGKQLSEYFGFSFVHEIARYFDKKLLIEEDTQYEILFTQIKCEMFAEKKNVITDRTCIDNYIYLSRNYKPRMYLLNLVRAWVNTYDIIFLCKKLPFVEDGFRINVDIEDKIITFMKCNLIDYYILEGNEIERFEKSKEIIERRLKIENY